MKKVRIIINKPEKLTTLFLRDIESNGCVRNVLDNPSRGTIDMIERLDISGGHWSIGYSVENGNISLIEVIEPTLPQELFDF